jgi:alanine racemase
VHDIRVRPTQPTDDGEPAQRLGDTPPRSAASRMGADIPAGATGVITVDLAQVRLNWLALARHVAPAECAAVVKADAYGLGAARVIPALLDAGCRSFFVATLEEARNARALAPGATIYILDGLLPRTEKDVAGLFAIPVLSCLDEARAWASLAGSAGSAPPAALHVDTGLNRLGMRDAELARLASDAVLLRHLNLALIMSHLACADEAGHPMNREQLATFTRLRARIPAARASLAASDGLMLGAAFHFDLVRPGYALYGGQAAPERVMPVRPVVRVSTRILQVQEVAPGSCVGYSASYRATTPRRIATIAAGYADGVFRHASATNDTPGGAVSIRGKRAPIVGRVSMDLITVDVTDLGDPAPARGDWADLIAPELPIESVGAGAKTIGYEVLTRLGPRFHRVYLDESN